MKLFSVFTPKPLMILKGTFLMVQRDKENKVLLFREDNNLLFAPVNTNSENYKLIEKLINKHVTIECKNVEKVGYTSFGKSGLFISNSDIAYVFEFIKILSSE